MKALNTIQFISNACEDLTNWKNQINAAETYEDTRRLGNCMLGYLDCMSTFCNTMVSEENNVLTGELDEVIRNWYAECYQAVADVAMRTKQSNMVIIDLLKKRDEARGW